MNFPSINIQGNIISSEIIEKIRIEDIKYQQSADFKLDKKSSVRDEIGFAWAAIRAHWTAFKIRAERLAEGESGVTSTRNSWMVPFFQEFGYSLQFKPGAEQINFKSYPISHRASNLSDSPVHIMGINDDLDKRRDTGGPRLSPHALMQEYLNNSDHVYALVSNGRYLRLLRDATRLVRLSYLEFDLEKMMEEELYADFAILFRLLHATRMPQHPDSLEESPIEYYHQESLASGSRIREKLSEAVESSIKLLANGFLSHPANTSLRQQIHQSNLSPEAYYLLQLRLIYRFLFLIVTEERNLVYLETKDPEAQRKRKVYYKFYSVERLRKLATRLHFVDGRKHDLWEGLKTTFQLFEQSSVGEKLGIKPLGSGLFSPVALGVLPDLTLSNEALLKVIRHLTLFENDQKNLVRVNYSDLDVEEFGSVYEGLLEYDAVFSDDNGKPVFSFVQGKGRSSSGSHYTPEELVKPLIKHSLEYIIGDKLKEKDKEKALLSVKVCDAACGSGHILLSAARRIAIDLARVRTNEDQPTPTALRYAIRDVIKHCIYGVDKNPLAVELCKVALWLEAHNPGEPLGFLDHHIKCGDAIVGLAHRKDLENGIADEAFKALPGDDKDIASSFAKRNKVERKERDTTGTQLKAEFQVSVQGNVQEALQEYGNFVKLSERTPEEIEMKQRAYAKFLNGKGYIFLKAMADTQVAAFFVPKAIENKDRLVTDGDFRQILRGYKSWQSQGTSRAMVVSQNQRFFHWFLEFPEVFQQGGFDCILGNPPFLGGGKISSTFGQAYLNFLFSHYPGVNGLADLVVYFFRRDFSLTNDKGFFACISTNTISQGDTRASGLDIITQGGGKIVFANKNVKWPGAAAVEITLVAISKANNAVPFLLNDKPVDAINSFLENSRTNSVANRLLMNAHQSFLGTAVQGGGFILSKNEAKHLLVNLVNQEIIQEYLTGDDINTDPHQIASQYVINFKDLSLDEAREFPELLTIVRERVKPDRDRNNRKTYREYWWQFGEKRSALYESLKNKKEALCSSRYTKHLAFSKCKANQVFSDALVVVNAIHPCQFTIMSSTMFSEWSWRNASTMGTGTLRFGPTDCVETFPFLQETAHDNVERLVQIGQIYYSLRRSLMLLLRLGLTKIYNLYHARYLTSVDIEVQSGCSPQTCDKGHQDLLKLRELHKAMDEAVLKFYGWEEIQLRHDFYEVDYLPENDRLRFTIHPEARKEILERLLQLNHKMHAAEVSRGLWNKKKSGSGKRPSNIAKEPKGGYGGLFEIN
jgi:hypothetical protein